MHSSDPPLRAHLGASLHVALLLALAGTGARAQSGLVVNEFMAQNTRTVADSAGGYDDWVELYNPASIPVDIGGFFLTDDLDRPTRYRIPDTDSLQTTIPAGGYLLLWFDGEPGQGLLHAGLRLDAQGEELGLFAPDTTVVDTLRFGLQSADVSYGRSATDPGAWLFFTRPTPGLPNAPDPAGLLLGDPRFSAPGGLKTGPFELSLSGPAGADLYYVLLRGEQSNPPPVPYEAPLPIDRTTVVRAWAESPSGTRSRTVSASYLFDEAGALPVVSLVTDPDNLWDWETGLYVEGPNADTTVWMRHGANFWQDWTRPAHVEWFEPGGRTGFELEPGLQMFGGRSRLDPKKGFKVDLDPAYGQSNLSYPLFDDHPTQRYESIIFRASTQDWWRVRNELVYYANRRAGGHVDMQNFRPVVLYLNGAYWGLYNAMETKGNDFFEDRHGVSDYDLIQGLYTTVIDGDRKTYKADLAWVNSPAYLSAGLDEIDRRFDTANLIEFWIFHFYAQESLTGNARWWRPRTPDGRWRWMIFDIDTWFKPDIVARATQRDTAAAYFVLGRMMQNSAFREAMITRTLDVLNTTLAPDTVRSLVASIASEIRGEMPRDLDRWGYFYEGVGPVRPQTFADWTYFVDQYLTLYALTRPTGIRNELRARYALGPDHTLALDAEGAGSVQVNTVTPSLPWSGVYLPDFPVTLSAVPAPGYRFAGWSDPSLPDSTTVRLLLDGDRALTARFEPIPPAAVVVLHEINYHDGPELDPGDWVEIYNPGDLPADLSGWRFSDDDDANAFVLPSGTAIDPQGTLVLCRDARAFARVYGPEGRTCLGDLAFGLNNGGERLRLFDAAGILADSLTFDDRDPWPALPDGHGPTLALIDPTFDNADPSNWAPSAAFGGTPGSPNVAAPDAPKLVIDEINYHSAPFFEPGDWVELHNPTGEEVSLAGWRLAALEADTSAAVLPPGTAIAPDGYLVLCADTATFRTTFTPIARALNRTIACTASLPFGFKNSGDRLLLLDLHRQVVDSVRYSDRAPWPEAADGHGYTLILEDPSLEKTRTASWTTSPQFGGSPGWPNSASGTPTAAEADTPLPTAFELATAYPNPFSHSTRIVVRLPEPARVEITVYNTAGQIVDLLTPGLLPAGEHAVSWTADRLGAGLYFYQLVADGAVRHTRSTVLLR